MSVLTDTQRRFLEAFFESQREPDPFYLSGGTALAAYYLHHRYSDDLDFFTRERSNLEPSAHREQLERALTRSSLHIESSARRGDHVQYLLAGDRGERPLTKIEFVFDAPRYLIAPERQDGVFVDGLLAIAVNKLTALGRREPKDYVDLYEIVRSGRYGLGDLVRLVPEKDPGVTPLVLATCFDDARDLSGVAAFLRRYMVIELNWDELVQFYRREAERLRGLVPPRARGGQE
ncbi:MAG: nucleotidyl transferase AbiEii/AbiGii toxin family protein [Candidatus Rokubacteria bacterium]|nr:nucleotidyl transferase AbiEii/AbiGii toxin family protein [Candidatus Rokubacteria bacterium]